MSGVSTMSHVPKADILVVTPNEEKKILPDRCEVIGYLRSYGKRKVHADRRQSHEKYATTTRVLLGCGREIVLKLVSSNVACYFKKN